MDITKMIIDANMQPLYMMKPEGAALEKVKDFERRLSEYASGHPGAADVVGEAGMRDEYTQLYMSLMNDTVGTSYDAVMGHIDEVSSEYDDAAIQTKIKAEISAILDALIFAWKDAKEKIHAGDEKMVKYAQAMVVTRKQTRRLYDFLYDDMGMSLEKMGSIWFDNMDPIRNVLFEEVLSSKSIKDILLF